MLKVRSAAAPVNANAAGAPRSQRAKARWKSWAGRRLIQLGCRPTPCRHDWLRLRQPAVAGARGWRRRQREGRAHRRVARTFTTAGLCSYARLLGVLGAAPQQLLRVGDFADFAHRVALVTAFLEHGNQLHRSLVRMLR